MSQMTELAFFIVYGVVVGTLAVVAIARETNRTHPELGDLPAALLTIFFVALIACGVEKLRRLNAEETDAASSVTQGRGR